MATFDTAFNILLQVEGGYNVTAGDTGGATKYGISQASHPQLDIENLTIDQAKQIYLDEYWNPLLCDHLDPLVAIPLFCEAVNAEGAGAKGVIVKLLQQTVGAVEDGFMGQETVSITNQQKPKNVSIYLNALFAMRYATLNNYATFGKGWMARLFKVYGLTKDALTLTTNNQR
ncbi:MAG: secretion activator protein [Patescibacteria group bacterium]|nr:secretion activator protein [Patescibacteria group bacterium]